MKVSREIIIAPSLLSSDFSHLAEEVEALDAAGCEYVHFDCMDGHFTDQVTYGPMVAKALRPYTERIFDCHLMFTNPEKHLEYFAEAGADNILFHYEVTAEPEVLLERIHALGCRAGLVLNPDTPVSVVEPLLGLCEAVMLMGVYVGYSGQSYIPETTQRIAELRALIDAGGHETLIEHDGGLNEDTAEEIVRAGTDIFVSGSFLFAHREGYGAAVRYLRDLAARVG